MKHILLFILLGFLSCKDEKISNKTVYDYYDRDSIARVVELEARIADSLNKKYTISDGDIIGNANIENNIQSVQRYYDKIKQQKSFITKDISSIEDIKNISDKYFDEEEKVKPSLDSNIPEVRSLAKKCDTHLSVLKQKDQFKMRRAYLNILKESLWRNNIDVKGSGTQLKTVTLIGGIFASNANIEDTYDLISTQLSMCGFTKLQFKWYSGSDEVTYYTIH